MIRRLMRCVVLFSLAGVVSAHTAAAQVDVKGSSDHQLFPVRMPGYYISSYRHIEFDVFRFRTPDGTVPVEGKKTTIIYRLQKDAKYQGGLAIRRNYENAIREAGGEVILHGGEYVTVRSISDGKEVWAEIKASNQAWSILYSVTIVERAEMNQVITANAMLDTLNKEGVIALYVTFDTGSAVIRPESGPVVAEIVRLLADNPTLKLGVEGHTDNVGAPESNRKLSEARARAVVAAVSAKGIDGARLTPAGFGQDRPIADNKTEEGRQKNRRVELVKK